VEEATDEVASGLRGNTYFAQEVNSAKDILLAWIEMGRPDLSKAQPNQTRTSTTASAPKGNVVLGVLAMTWMALLGLGKGIATVAIWGFIGLVLLGAWVRYSEKTGPRCEVLQVNVAEHIFSTKGESDYGFVIVAPVKNHGIKGVINVDLTLETTQGDFQRKFQGEFDAGENKNIQGEFQEPTLGVADVKGRVKCSPG
jgi:hypothetical protein